MQLILDYGNTKVKVAIFNGDELLQRTTFKSLSVQKLQPILEEWQPKQCILCSVRDHNKEVEDYLAENGFFIILDHDTPLPFINKYKSPQTLGKDRIALAAGANALYPNEHVLAIDPGTCITYDFINDQQEYLGGSISPGLTMRLKALNTFTDQLPLVKRNEDFTHLIGQTTEESIITGVMHATVREMDGMIAAYREKYGPLKVLMAGGDGKYFATQLKSEIFAVPNLVLIGLNKILSYNAVKKQ